MLDAGVYAQEPNMGANRGGSNNINRLRRRAFRVYTSMIKAFEAESHEQASAQDSNTEVAANRQAVP